MNVLYVHFTTVCSWIDLDASDHKAPSGIVAKSDVTDTKQPTDLNINSEADSGRYFFLIF